MNIDVAKIFVFPKFFFTQKCNHATLQSSPYLEKKPIIPLLLEHTGMVSDVRQSMDFPI